MDFNKLNKEKGIKNACKIKSKLVSSLTQTIKERLRNYSDEKEVYNAMQIIDPEHWIDDDHRGARPYTHTFVIGAPSIYRIDKSCRPFKVDYVIQHCDWLISDLHCVI